MILVTDIMVGSHKNYVLIRVIIDERLVLVKRNKLLNFKNEGSINSEIAYTHSML